MLLLTINNSQNQLHACLKTLGQRKYLSLHEWSTVLRALDSQKEFGRVWDVELSGNRFTDAQIRRKRKYAKYTDPIASCLEEAGKLLMILALKLQMTDDISYRSTAQTTS